MDKDDGLRPELKHHRHQKYFMYCGCVTALILITVVPVFTVFGVRSPKVKMNSLKIEGLDRVNWTDIRPETNVTIIADVFVKNPNIASFKFNNASTYLYYDGNVVGEAKTPRTNVRAGRTLRLNVTVDVMLAKVLNVSRLQADYLAGMMPMNSYTRISGRIKILNIIKKGVILKTHCTVKVNVTSYTIEHQQCKRKVTM